jgi:hypothetical protein
MERMVRGGWQLVKCKYCIWLVGFMWMPVINLPSVTVRSTSRKVAVTGDWEWVNFKVENSLRASMNCVNAASPCVHRTKMSSMNLLHIKGLSGWEDRNSCSRRPITKLA